MSDLQDALADVDDLTDGSEPDTFWVIVEAARRVANPDYRAGVVEWIGDEPPDNYPDEFDWEDMIQSTLTQTVKPVVDAALGITEDE